MLLQLGDDLAKLVGLVLEDVELDVVGQIDQRLQLRREDEVVKRDPVTGGLQPLDRLHDLTVDQLVLQELEHHQLSVGSCRSGR